MYKYAVSDIPVVAVESASRQRQILACRIKDVAEADPSFEVDELLIPRLRRDPLWNEGEGFVALGEVLFAAYGESLADVEINDVAVVALTDLVMDRKEFLSEYQEILDSIEKRDDVKNNLDDDKKKEEESKKELQEKIAAARKRVDGAE